MIGNVRASVFDSDCVSSYPSDTLVCNVSKETTKKEIIKIGDIPKYTFTRQMINLLSGPVNAIEFCTTMFGFPTVGELGKQYEIERK